MKSAREVAHDIINLLRLWCPTQVGSHFHSIECDNLTKLVEDRDKEGGSYINVHPVEVDNTETKAIVRWLLRCDNNVNASLRLDSGAWRDELAAWERNNEVEPINKAKP